MVGRIEATANVVSGSEVGKALIQKSGDELMTTTGESLPDFLTLEERKRLENPNQEDTMFSGMTVVDKVKEMSGEPVLTIVSEKMGVVTEEMMNAVVQTVTTVGETAEEVVPTVEMAVPVVTTIPETQGAELPISDSEGQVEETEKQVAKIVEKTVPT